MKRLTALCGILAAIVLLTGCVGTPLGSGYYYTQDYPYGVIKRDGEVVLPPSGKGHDTLYYANADLVVRVDWNDEVILAVSVYPEVTAQDSTIWKLDKKSGKVDEITPSHYQSLLNSSKMKSNCVTKRYSSSPK